MISPGMTPPQEESIYTIRLSSDHSRVIVISGDRWVRGYRPRRWLPPSTDLFSPGDLQELGEMIASQRLFEGLLIGLSGDDLIDRWQRLFRTHAEQPLFRWRD